MNEQKHSNPVHALIAIVTPNTLMGLGLSGLIERAFPVAHTQLFACFSDMQAVEPDRFFHYFVSIQPLLEAPDFFNRHRQRTIVITEGETALIPAGYHQINASLPEEQLVKAFLKLEQQGHKGGQHIPANIQQAVVRQQSQTHLTPREKDVLRDIAQGFLNKEIASHLNISLTTVISHRKNLTSKLGIHSVSGLTIYAVMNGLVRAEDI